MITTMTGFKVRLSKKAQKKWDTLKIKNKPKRKQDPVDAGYKFDEWFDTHQLFKGGLYG